MFVCVQMRERERERERERDKEREEVKERVTTVRTFGFKKGRR